MHWKVILLSSFLTQVAFADQSVLEKWKGRSFTDYMTQDVHSNTLELIAGTPHYRDTFGDNDSCSVQIFLDKAQVIQKISITKGSYQNCEKYFPRSSQQK